ncbi:MAG: aminotransferase class I/II-fold pyridoxal phosphate-dependent enzyme, partial [Bacteroidales bacterium]
MPQISDIGKQMPASPIRKLVPYAEEAKSKGRKVYHLNIGQPDIPTPEVALDAVKNISVKVIEYSHSAGNESYRKGLAKYYKSVNIDVDHTEMLITTGGSEAITFAFLSTLNPGDEVIVPEPFYANYNGFAVSAGVVVKPITSSIENNFALPPIEEFEKLITSKTKGIVICNPNNPTGYLYSESELKQLQKLIEKHDLYLYSDEVYREFC